MRKTNLTSRCADWLRNYLADGPRDSQDIRDAAFAAGFTVRSLKDAAERLDIISEHSRLQHRNWRLPEATSNETVA